MDACDMGCGGWNGRQFFYATFPEWIKNDPNVAINELECKAFVLALKCWVSAGTGKNVLAYCNNQVTVNVINSGKAGNSFTKSCLREIFFICAVNDTQIKVIHKPSRLNKIPDCLSRISKDPKQWHIFKQLTEGLEVEQILIKGEDFKFTRMVIGIVLYLQMKNSGLWCSK